MSRLVFGAILGAVWLLVGVPLAPALAVLSVLVQPVTLGFIAAAAARPYVRPSGRWTV